FFAGKRIGITGSPGTGKKSVGKKLAELTGLKFISINDFAIKNHFARRENAEYVVDLRKLWRKIGTRDRIVVGHLLPYLIPNRDLDLVIVLRCSPRVLRRRYESRRYSEKKIIENIEAELIGLIAEKAAEKYSRDKLAEFDTSRTKPETISRRIASIIKGTRLPSFGSIDWLTTATPSAFTETLHGKCNRLNIPKRITRFANPKARKSTY
ncbi:MAG TPA: adenylate kinase family protein, partial [Nitrososphaerales archaeon]|nr:adenylate kinase family protein [Nitrososphaerales archaeon]